MTSIQFATLALSTTTGTVLPDVLAEVDVSSATTFCYLVADGSASREPTAPRADAEEHLRALAGREADLAEQPMGRCGGEDSLDQVVVNGRTRPAVHAPLLGVDRPDALQRAQALDPVLACHEALGSAERRPPTTSPSSSWRTVVMAVTISIGLGAILCVSQVQQWGTMTAQQRATFDPTSCSLFGVMIAAVLLGALAVWSVTAEYASGMIRSTFTAMPARRLVLASKAATIAVFAFPAALVSNLVAFEIGQRIFTSKHLQVTLGHPGVLGAIVFGAVAVSLVAVIGVGLGGIIRHTAGATTTMAVVIVGGVTLGQLLPTALRGYLPGTAIQAAVTVHRSPGILAPGTAIVVLGIYAAITLAAASMRAAHGDA